MAPVLRALFARLTPGFPVPADGVRVVSLISPLTLLSTLRLVACQWRESSQACSAKTSFIQPVSAPSRLRRPGWRSLPAVAWCFWGRGGDHQRGLSPSPVAGRLCRDLTGGGGQRLWMSIAGSSSIRP
jgi:hypothetical protein